MQIHDSHLTDLKKNTQHFFVAVLIAFAGLGIQNSDLLFLGEYFLTVHTFLEMIAITISLLVFSIGWNTRHYVVSSRLLLLSCLMLPVAIFDFFHVISYSGMPDFITPSGSEKAINFWLMARLFSTFALIAYAIGAWFKLPKLSGGALVICTITITFLISYFMLFHADLFPRTFNEQAGLTRFKIISEYIVIGFFCIAIALLAQSWGKPKDKTNNISALINVALIAILSEFFFTLYRDVTDIYNLFGHLLKIVAYYHLYKAVFVESVTSPYQSLNKAKKELSLTLQSIPETVFEVSKNGELLNIYTQKDNAGLVKVEDIGKSISSVLPAAVSSSISSALQSAQTQATSIRSSVYSERNGTPQHLEMDVTPLEKNSTFLVTARDVTARNLRIEKIEMLSHVVEQSPNPILVTNTDAEIEYVNRAYEDFSGYTKKELLGKDPNVVASQKTKPQVYEEMWRNIRSGSMWEGDLINVNKQGIERVQHTTIFPMKDEHGVTKKYISFQSDVTQILENERRIETLFYEDELTALPNRNAFENTFNHLSHNQGAIFYIDLDNFKLVNEGLGMGSGNEVLKILADRLRTIATNERRIFRVGGDVYVLSTDEQETNALTKLATQILTLVKQPFNVGKETFVLTASIGVYLFQKPKDSASNTLEYAESAMYHAKSQGRNNFQFFAQHLKNEASKQLKLVNALSFAIEKNEFSLVYQPQADISGQSMSGAEVLIRWYSKDLGAIPPDEFIPLAEASGKISDIDEWVFRTAAQQLKQWQNEGFTNVTLSVNISAVRFEDPLLLNKLLAILDNEELHASSFELELTETIAMRNPDVALKTIQSLRKAGFKIALDDFGTGYSSVSYLLKFGIDKLKIDRSFVNDIDATDSGPAIVRSMIELAHNLGISVIAEGVETEAQRKALEQLDCDEIQGYLFSKPLNTKDTGSLIKRLQNS